MPLTEAETRVRLIDPAMHERGWTEDLIRREETPGAVEIIDGGPRRAGRGRTDYTLRVKVSASAQPVAVAVLEAKPEDKPPTHGLEQAKQYQQTTRLHVPFVISTNGHQWVEFDRMTGLTSRIPRPMSEFPTPDELRRRYEEVVGIDLTAAAARPLLSAYQRGETSRRYYQDAAIRAVLERLARGEKRALLSLATGAGKTFIAVNLLRKIADAGQLRRALFLCDRDELRQQGLAAFSNAFGSDAAAATGNDPQKNARIVVATYQTLDIATDDANASFLADNYPTDYFSHIIIDECHRSAWGKWSEVLRRNPSAAQVGLTATPRQLTLPPTGEADLDRDISSDNVRHFGEAVYEYDIGQGIEDGYLAACEIIRRDIFLDDSPFAERDSGVDRSDLAKKMLADARTGEILAVGEARSYYAAQSFESRLLLPERVDAMASDLFDQLVATGGAEQKTIIFCARDEHADRVAAALNNRYARWCVAEGRRRVDPYAFKCTAASHGSEFLSDLRGASRHHFIATTVDLLTTGVDIPAVRNIVFFRYVRSPIAFYQMVGRGTRIDPVTNKLMFRVYDYTGATSLFGETFRSRATIDRDSPGPVVPTTERRIQVLGFEVRVSDAGRAVLTVVDGQTVPLSLEEYKDRLAAKLVDEAPNLERFRERWISPSDRAAMMHALPDGGRSASLVATIEGLGDYDLYDVLAEIGYGLEPKTRIDRAAAFGYKHADWLEGLPAETTATLQALTRQFARAGTSELESPVVLQTPEVVAAGGLAALKLLGRPADILRATKERLFAT